MKVVWQASRSVLLMAWTAAGAGPAWAQDAAAPAEETSKWEDEICQRLRHALGDTWADGADVLRDRELATVARFTSLFDDYIERYSKHTYFSVAHATPHCPLADAFRIVGPAPSRGADVRDRHDGTARLGGFLWRRVMQ